MASVMENFSNQSIDLTSLPQYEEVKFNAVSGQYLIKTNIQTGIFLFLVLVGWGAMFYFDVDLWTLVVVSVVIPLFFAFKFWNNFMLQKKYGYALREKDILYRRGFFVNAVTIVPFNRIQHASISRDVWDKFLGISSLQIFTAGGSGSDISIPGLTPELAQRLKEALAGKINEDEN